MKKTGIKAAIILLLLTILLSSCVSTTPIFYSNNTNYDFVILGIVTYQGTKRTGFQDLLQEAKRQYPSADYIIDIMTDRKVTQFLFFKYVHMSTSYTMRATAIQYIRRDINGVIISAPTPTQNPPGLLNNTRGAQAISAEYTVVSVSGRVVKFVNMEWVDVSPGEILI
ncbi:MAG: hypothetical protein FWD14_08505 [Treponema sp.]|nr:hypothetical protein [Treponema sp.]